MLLFYIQFEHRDYVNMWSIGLPTPSIIFILSHFLSNVCPFSFTLPFAVRCPFYGNLCVPHLSANNQPTETSSIKVWTFYLRINIYIEIHKPITIYSLFSSSECIRNFGRNRLDRCLQKLKQNRGIQPSDEDQKLKNLPVNLFYFELYLGIPSFWFYMK